MAAVVTVLLLGAGVAWAIDGALGLSHSPADVPDETAVAAPLRAPAPVPPLVSLVVPTEPRAVKAAAAVADALATRGRARPTVTPVPAGRTAPQPRPTGTLSTARTLRAERHGVGGPPESYRIGVRGAELTVEAGDVAGLAAALYRLADRIRSGAEVLPAAEVGRLVTPRLGLRLTDAGSVGREPDPAVFAAGDDYSLNTDVVSPALLPRAPWVDPAAVARIDAQWRQFVDHSVAQGYNGVVVPGFLEYVTFAGVGDGHAVYPRGDPHVARARAMVAAFGPVFRYAHEMGLKVFLLTDMLAVSPPLEAYLRATVGGLDAADPRLWSVYRAGLAELFGSMPFVAGLMVRVGEGGAVYAGDGWDYTSKLAVTTAAGVRAMLRALLDTAATAGKEIIFRSWTVGVGTVGNLHTDPDSYAEVLGGFTDPHLIVSTKYTLGDFYSHLPLNTTLLHGGQRRIVEFQARREFEGFGALPNDLGPLHRTALRTFLAANPHVEGVWNWTQDGGPLHAGPMSLYLRTGFWQLYDLNTYAVARLAWDPETDPAQVTADWAYRTLSADPATVAAIGQAMALSRAAVTTGLYIGPYADTSARALGLAPPPMMWIFEWDIPTGDSAALDSIYAITGERIDAAVAEGGEAVALARRMRALIAGTDAARWRDAALRQRFVDALDYQVDLFETLAAYRAMVLRHVQWLDTGSDVAYADWRSAAVRYRQARDRHRQRYGGDLDLPAYRFTAADLGARRADRDPAMAWLARALLLLVGAVALLGLRGRGPGGAGARALLVGALCPWRVAALPPPATRTDRVLVRLVPVLVLVSSRLALTWFAAPAHLLLTLAGWGLYALVLRLVVGRREPFHLWAVLGGVALLRSALLLAALAGRGPGRYWFLFWTAPGRRAAYLVLAVAAFCWLFVATAVVLRDRYGATRRRAVGHLLTAVGVPLAGLAGLVAAVGAERALTVWNDQLALLPWGLSRILGITVYLGVPASLPGVAALVGVTMAATGFVLSARRRRAGAAGQVRSTLA
ncbi:Glycosyl hydrolase family 67 C-terminus [Micromonospora auratinigra]|uniref:Glycosyl hydrolase family 67 C-terminus n=1 Tax=Micromonospora auratinigra TaxID=261654 RepID=A0A1A8ZGE8_9ACTN|nr:Glycosyl hydrolase family 67 C-terminus [Micromonospora auratinigra]